MRFFEVVSSWEQFKDKSGMMCLYNKNAQFAQFVIPKNILRKVVYSTKSDLE